VKIGRTPAWRLECCARGAACFVAAQIDDVVAVWAYKFMKLLRPPKRCSAEVTMDLGHLRKVERASRHVGYDDGKHVLWKSAGWGAWGSLFAVVVCVRGGRRRPTVGRRALGRLDPPLRDDRELGPAHRGTRLSRRHLSRGGGLVRSRPCLSVDATPRAPKSEAQDRADRNGVLRRLVRGGTARHTHRLREAMRRSPHLRDRRRVGTWGLRATRRVLARSAVVAPT
jgi:hypothetical protein